MGDRSPAVPRLVCGTAALVLAPDVWACHHRVWSDDFPDYETWYRDLFEKHAGRAGHRLALAQQDDIVTGYAWGYVGQRGQHWSDRLCEALKTGDVVSVDLDKATVTVAATGKVYSFKPL